MIGLSVHYDGLEVFTIEDGKINGQIVRHINFLFREMT